MFDEHKLCDGCKAWLLRLMIPNEEAGVPTLKHLRSRRRDRSVNKLKTVKMVTHTLL